LNQLQSFQILVELDSKLRRMIGKFESRSIQLRLPDLAALQNLCANDGPNKKRGASNGHQGTGDGTGFGGRPVGNDCAGKSR
jgi:hypothetical protein